MKTKIKLSMHKMNTAELLVFATHVVTGMTGNVFFTAPVPSLEAVSSAITALQNANNKAQDGSTAQTALMNQSKEALKDLLTALGHYVETVANSGDHTDTGNDAVVLSAGMGVKQFTPAQRKVFTVKNGKLSGTVELIATSVSRGAHEWQYALDASANGWGYANVTLQATTIITGLEVAKRYTFRHRAVLKSGPVEWDDPQSIVVT